MNILFHYPFVLSLQYFHDPGRSHGNYFTEMKPSQFPAKGKRRGKERGGHGEERKQKMRRRCRFLPSVRVTTLEAVIVLDKPKPT